MKRIINLMLVLMLAAGVLVTPALAVGEDYTFTLTVNGGSEAAVMVGDTVTVALHVKDNRADSVELYGMQDYINFDPEYLEFVPGSESYFSIKGFPVINGSALRGGEVLVNRASMKALSIPNGSVMMQFDLRALKAGDLDVYSSGEEMIDQDASLFTVALKDAQISIRDPHVHTLQHVAEKPATEQASGVKEHWICTGCNKLFWDKDGQREATESELLLPQLQHVHTLVHNPGKPATESLLGLKEHWKCSGCGKLFLDKDGKQETTQANLELPKLPHIHKLEAIPEKPATVNSTGLKAHWRCSGCGKLYLDKNAAQEVAKEDLIIPVLPPVPVLPVEPEGPTAFTDVPANAWYAPAVDWAVKNNVTKGTSQTTFGPDEPCTRAQIVTFLWNAAGKPNPVAKVSPFSDVTPNNWFFKPVLWAAEQNITAGVSKTQFGSDLPCTRSQAMTFLWKYLGRPAAKADIPFTDVTASDWFAAPVEWAVANNITAGISPTQFGSVDTCTRGQIVTFLWKALK